MLAELTADDLTPTGVVLSTGTAETGMSEQSHVEVGDPTFLLHDYLRRMRSILTASAGDHFDDGAPHTALHLGAGALTLPRWMELHWPQVSQTVVDYELELVDFVLRLLPMRVAPESVVADAADALQGELADRQFDVVVVDLYNSSDAPQRLTSTDFFSAVQQKLSSRGMMLMNFGDDADMRFARRIVRTLLETVHREAALLTGPQSVLGAEEEGNLVLATAPGSRFTPEQLSQIWAAGPHPGEVLSGVQLSSWASST